MPSDPLSLVAQALGLPADAPAEAVVRRAREAGHALALLPSAEAQPEPAGGHGDVMLDLAALCGEEQTRLRGLVLARRAVGMRRYGVPLRYGAGVPWLRELRHELVDAGAYALLGRWSSLARRLVCVTGRVQARMDGEVERG